MRDATEAPAVPRNEIGVRSTGSWVAGKFLQTTYNDRMSTARNAITGAAILLLAGCSLGAFPAGPSQNPSPSPSSSPTAAASPTVSASVEPSPTPSATGSSGAKLPQPFKMDAPLGEGTSAAEVIEQLMAVSGKRPALKLDVTSSQATLTVLEEDESVSSFRWANGVIDITTSDFQYLGQATFSPEDYPLESIGRMFDIADLRGVRGELVYQVQEYRAGDVVQTVSSLPESSTVFFEQDGSAIPSLDGSHTADILAGHEAVVRPGEELVSFGYSPERGFHSESLTVDDRITRTRTGGIPTVEAARPRTGSREGFDPALVDPMIVAQALQAQRATPDELCAFDIAMDEKHNAPLVEIRCGEETSLVDLKGREVNES